MLYWLVAALLLVLVPAHLIWLLDRRSKDGISTSENYFPGIFDAMAWTAEAMLGQAPRMPEHKFAHLLAIPWLFTGVVFVAFFTAQLTTSLTLEQIRGVINGPGDLPGKAVATLAGTTSADYLREIGARADGSRISKKCTRPCSPEGWTPWFCRLRCCGTTRRMMGWAK